MADIQRNVVKKGKRSWVPDFLKVGGDKGAIVAWKQDLMGILHVFNVRLVGLAWHLLTASS